MFLTEANNILLGQMDKFHCIWVKKFYKKITHFNVNSKLMIWYFLSAYNILVFEYSGNFNR